MRCPSSFSATTGVPDEIRDMAPLQFWETVRSGRWNKPTAGCCNGFTQLNLVVLPQRYADDFKRFCQRNPKPCPLLEILAPGTHEAVKLAPGSDLRTDIPGYKVFRGSNVAERATVVDIWQDDFVSFLIGCSFTFENALLAGGVPVRHIEIGCNVPMYLTSIPCQAAGPFHSQLVVSMRPVPAPLVEKTYAITARYPAVHGAPIHHGDPAQIGIDDLGAPDFGDPVPVRNDEIPVFWACGVTPQAALMNACPDIAITHYPGHMFVSNVRDAAFLDQPGPGGDKP